MKVVQKLFKEISNKSKIKEILFKYFIIKLPRPSKQWTFFVFLKRLTQQNNSYLNKINKKK